VRCGAVPFGPNQMTKFGSRRKKEDVADEFYDHLDVLK
jgi:hypothetical protein